LLSVGCYSRESWHRGRRVQLRRPTRSGLRSCTLGILVLRFRQETIVTKCLRTQAPYISLSVIPIHVDDGIPAGLAQGGIFPGVVRAIAALGHELRVFISCNQVPRDGERPTDLDPMLRMTVKAISHDEVAGGDHHHLGAFVALAKGSSRPQLPRE